MSNQDDRTPPPAPPRLVEEKRSVGADALHAATLAVDSFAAGYSLKAGADAWEATKAKIGGGNQPPPPPRKED